MTDGDQYPCPCDDCDRWTLSPDEYCVTCLHHGCGLEPQCP